MPALLAITVLCGVCQQSGAGVVAGRGGEATAGTLGQRYEVQSADPANVALVADPAGAPRKVWHLKLNATDAKVAGGQRTELSAKYEYIKSGRRWYALSVRVPSSWAPTSQPISLAQIHANPRSAPLPPQYHFSFKTTACTSTCAVTTGTVARMLA